MKKVLCIMLAVFGLFFAVNMALAQQRPFTGLFVAEETKKLDTAPMKMLFDGSLPINLSGDTIYRVRAGSIDAGVGIDLASYKDLCVLRAEASQSTEGEGSFAGVGLFVNVPTLINMITGASWNASYFNPSIGIVPGYDFKDNKFDAGIVLSIIQVNF